MNIRYIVLVIISIALLSISHTINESEFLRLLLLELGIAGIIALILIFTIEKITKEEREKATKSQIQDITENLFNAIFKRYIPDSVFSEVERCLFSSDVVRTNYRVDYDIGDISQINNFPDDDKQNYLACSIRTSFDLKNISDKEIEYDVRSFIELPMDEKLQKFVNFQSFSVDNVDIGITGVEKSDGSHTILTKSVKIGPKSKVSIVTKYATIKRKTDSEIWASLIPSDGIKIAISSPPSIQVKASANHSTKLIHSLISSTNIITKQEWSINTGIFPHQSVIFWWSDSTHD